MPCDAAGNEATLEHKLEQLTDLAAKWGLGGGRRCAA